MTQAEHLALCARWRDYHDEAAAVSLLRDRQVCVRTYAARYAQTCRRPWFDVEDLLQVGSMAVIGAAERYEDRGVASFVTYCEVRVESAIRQHAVHLSLHRREYRTWIQANDADLRTHAARPYAGASHAEVVARADVDAILARLSGRSAEVLRFRAAGLGDKEIGVRQGVCRRAANERVRRAIAEAREVIACAC